MLRMSRLVDNSMFLWCANHPDSNSHPWRYVQCSLVRSRTCVFAKEMIRDENLHTFMWNMFLPIDIHFMQLNKSIFVQPLGWEFDCTRLPHSWNESIWKIRARVHRCVCRTHWIAWHTRCCLAPSICAQHHVRTQQSQLRLARCLAQRIYWFSIGDDWIILLIPRTRL